MKSGSDTSMYLLNHLSRSSGVLDLVILFVHDQGLRDRVATHMRPVWVADPVYHPRSSAPSCWPKNELPTCSTQGTSQARKVSSEASSCRQLVGAGVVSSASTLAYIACRCRQCGKGKCTRDLGRMGTSHGACQALDLPTCCSGSCGRHVQGLARQEQDVQATVQQCGGLTVRCSFTPL